MNSDFWNGKKVFITGHTGFKGGWLTIWLKNVGASVAGYSIDPPTDPSMFELCDVANGITSHYGDVRDPANLQARLDEFQPDIVLHMAAQPLVRASYDEPALTFETNVMGTVNVLEAVRRVPSVRAVVCITSDKCYKNREWEWSYRENEEVGGDDPYSASKAMAELAVEAQRKSFFNVENYDKHGVAIATVRAGNVIGGGDWAADRLVPDTVAALLAREAVSVRNPGATRPWQHVLEPLNGYLILAEQLFNNGVEYSGSWNFGPSEANNKDVAYIVENLSRLWGLADPWQRDSQDHPHENTFLKLDSSKAYARLGWRPKLDLITTLSWIVDWSKAYGSGGDLRQFTESQIEAFMDIGSDASRTGQRDGDVDLQAVKSG
jgi:CDP-glucose 4,6-dehydratase